MATKLKGLETFDDARYDEESRHRAQMSRVHNDRMWVLETLEKIKVNGITLIDGYTASTTKTMYDFDIYDAAQKQCDGLRRPYVKCWESNGKPIIVIPNNSWCKGLCVTLLILARPPEEVQEIINSRTTGTRFEMVTPGPGVYSKHSVLSWVKPRSMTFQFNGDEGQAHFQNWVNYCTNNHYAKTILGTY